MFTLLLTYAAALLLNAGSCDPYTTISDNIHAEHLRSAGPVVRQDSLAASCLATMTSGGNWTDINYASVSMTEWPARIHLERLLLLSTAYVNPRSGSYASREIFDGIVRGLEWWNRNRPTSRNWWYQWVEVPQKVGLILILMRHGSEAIPKQLETDLLETMRNTAGDPEESGSKGSAANKIDVALHWIYRGVLTQDGTVLEKGFRNIYQPITRTLGEGIQYDYSYLQHGPQLYIGGYGEVLLEKVSWAAAAAMGTEYALPEEKREILSKFVLDTYLPAIAGRWILGNVAGRQIARKGALDKTPLIPTLERMKRLDAADSLRYGEAIAGIGSSRPGPYGNPCRFRHFWAADYTLSSMDCGQFDVRMVSRRTFRSENGNGENLLGYFLSDGATFITVDGDEYRDVFPLWDWSSISGTTAPHLPKDSIPVPREWGVPGSVDFAGGVEGERCGLTAYRYADSHPSVRSRALKSWFFCRDEVVCIGSALASESGYPLKTTVNQTRARGGVYYQTGGTVDSLAAGQSLAERQPEWVWHNRVGYRFPWKSRIAMSNRPASGDWREINRGTPSETVTDTLFTLAVDHGVKPRQERYAYVVIRNIPLEEMTSRDSEELEILQADTCLHAIHDRRSDSWGFAFFAAGRYASDRLEIAVDTPCLILLERSPETGRYAMSIASPEQTHPQIEVELRVDGGMKRHMTARFPVNDKRYAGRTCRYEPFN